MQTLDSLIIKRRVWDSGSKLNIHPYSAEWRGHGLETAIESANSPAGLTAGYLFEDSRICRSRSLTLSQAEVKKVEER